MKGYCDAAPENKSWAARYRFEGWPEWVPVYCTRCGDHMYDQKVNVGMSGKMCDDCKAISHMFSQRKYRASGRW